MTLPGQLGAKGVGVLWVFRWRNLRQEGLPFWLCYLANSRWFACLLAAWWNPWPVAKSIVSWWPMMAMPMHGARETRPGWAMFLSFDGPLFFFKTSCDGPRYRNRVIRWCSARVSWAWVEMKTLLLPKWWRFTTSCRLLLVRPDDGNFAPRKSWKFCSFLLLVFFGSRITVERFVGVKMTMNCNPANFSAMKYRFWIELMTFSAWGGCGAPLSWASWAWEKWPLLTVFQWPSAPLPRVTTPTRPGWLACEEPP